MIKIKTKLDAGIYESHGGGQTRTHYVYATGPRNLLKAIKKLSEHRRDMERGFGNIGCGGSWLEVDGTRIDQFDLDEVVMDYPKDFDFVKSPSGRAKELLDRIISKEY